MRLAVDYSLLASRRIPWIAVLCLLFALPGSRQVRGAEMSLGEAILARADGESSAEADDYEFLDRHYGVLRRVVRRIKPTVVHIQATKRTTRVTSGVSSDVEESGAGVIYRYRDRHYVITNRHVVADTDVNRIRIQLSDGRFFRPTQVRSDRDYDLAVLYTEEDDLEAAIFGDSDDVDIGDFVIAIGSPFGLNHSVSYGIISALGRRDLDLGAEGVRFQNFLQTDAAINPGNSGGPLINLRGQVVGINTAIASNSGGNDGIGFTIPANMAIKVVNHLIDYGRVRRGFLGVTLDASYNADSAARIGLRTAYGARISSVTPQTPAAQASLEVGDVILSFDGVSIINDSHLVSQVSMTEINRTVPLVVYRNGERRTFMVTISERSGEVEARR